MHTTFWHEKAAESELSKKYVELYRAKYGQTDEVNVFGALAADCYLIVLDAIKRAGSTDPKKIRGSHRSHKGPSGRYRLSHH